RRGGAPRTDSHASCHGRHCPDSNVDCVVADTPFGKLKAGSAREPSHGAREMIQSTNTSTPSRPWLRVLVRSLFALILLTALTGFIYENISEARDRRFHPMPGQLVDI